MLGPYENEEEMMKCILYWQARALESEKWLEESLDTCEDYVDIILKERDEHKKEIMELKKKLYKR